MRRCISKRENEEGFTLAELLVVIMVLGVLAAIAIPTFTGTQTSARQAAVSSAASNAYKIAHVADLTKSQTPQEAIASMATKDVSVSFVDTDGDVVENPVEGLCVRAEWRVGTEVAFSGKCSPTLLPEGEAPVGGSPEDGSNPGSNPGDGEVGGGDPVGEDEDGEGSDTAPDGDVGGVIEAPDAPIMEEPNAEKLITSYTVKCPGTLNEVTLPPTGFVGEINWSDGTTSTSTDEIKRVIPGQEYNVTLKGTFTGFKNWLLQPNKHHASCFTAMNTWGEDTGVVSAGYAFSQMINLVSVPYAIPSSVTKTHYMFHGARKFDQDISDWDMSKVTAMTSMFSGAEQFDAPIGKWKVDSLKNASSIFKGAFRFNQPLGDWNMENAVNIDSIFSGASRMSQALNNWDLSNVENFTNWRYNSGILDSQVPAGWENRR